MSLKFKMLDVSAQKFNLLQKAKEILSDPERRAEYDAWRRSGLAVSYDQWVSRKNIQTVNITFLCFTMAIIIYSMSRKEAVSRNLKTFLI